MFFSTYRASRLNIISAIRDLPDTLQSRLQESRLRIIARALVNAPEIIWADEPTGDLDSETAQEIMELILDLNERNRQTFIIVTHAQEIGDQRHRIVRMRDGRIEGQ